MRAPLTSERLREVMVELGRAAPRGSTGRVYLVGGSTAVLAGWRASTIDVDLHGAPEVIFRDIQRIKERLGVNVEFARPEDFVPPLADTEARHVFIETIGSVSFFHHDPYAQVFSKIVRGFDRDLQDAEKFVSSGMVDVAQLRKLVHGIDDAAYARYPSLSRDAVVGAVDAFALELGGAEPA
jgi:hypothetical protein